MATAVVQETMKEVVVESATLDIPDKMASGKKRAKKSTTPQNDEINKEKSTDVQEESITTTTEKQQFLIVAKSVRTFLKNLPQACHLSQDALPMLNQKVLDMLLVASARAHANSRKTIKSSDF